MKKVILNEDRCIGCGACMSVAPDNFTFNDEGRTEMISDEITNEAIEASEMCPVSAITIENSCDCNCECSCGDECNCTEENKCSEHCHCNE